MGTTIGSQNAWTLSLSVHSNEYYFEWPNRTVAVHTVTIRMFEYWYHHYYYYKYAYHSHHHILVLPIIPYGYDNTCTKQGYSANRLSNSFFANR